MRVTILDEEGIRTINYDQETIMCPECNATNEGHNNRCNTCGCELWRTEHDIT